MSSPAFPLSLIVDVVVEVSPQQATAPLFNQCLIIGTSTAIPSVGANSRLRQYSTLAGMVSDGFATNSPEYIAAQILLSQSPAPTTFWVGRQDLTALKTIIPHSGNAGTGYAVGDQVTVTQGGAMGGTATVATVGGSGNVTGLTVNTAADGTGYTVANGLATTTTGAGTALEVDITAVGETPLVSVQNCRTASSIWWAVCSLPAVTADVEAIAGYVEAMQPVGFQFYTTSDAAVLNGTTGNVGATLKAAGYKRDFGVYSTTQGGAAPNNIYAAVAAMGVMMGLNTGLANSAFTMMFKQMVGITTEPGLTQTQRTTILGNNINLYDGFANSYVFLEQGQTPTTNLFADQVLNRDIWTADIQYTIMNLLVGSPAISQTDPGQTQLIHAVNQACQDQVVRGYLAGGTWKGVQILNLAPGTALPSGYLAQSPPYSQQSQADTNARKSQPIYVAGIEAGAVQSVLVGVYIQP